MSTNRATQDLLDRLHGLIAEDMLTKLQSGSCEAKDWAVIVKFLKDNGIDSLASDTDAAASAFDALVKAAQASIGSAHPN